MRIAYFSPLPPKRTGVATYSFHLARALSERAEIDFFDRLPAAAPVPERPILDYVEKPELLLGLPAYDGVLYHFGNNPHFHLDIYRAFLANPSAIVLHDTVLYFLIAGLGQGGMLREFTYNYGANRLGEFFAIEAESPDQDVLRYQSPERYPFLKRIVSLAPRIVVHSETSAAVIRAAGAAGEVHVIPHLAYPSMIEAANPHGQNETRAELGIADDELLIGCFGFIGPTKRISVLFRALARLKGRLRFKLLIVGEGTYIAQDIIDLGLSGEVIHTGFVEESRFNRLLRSIDLLVNLRFPSMGETSGPLTQAMACGTPSIVSDHAWFAELPDDTVRKIGTGETELEDLTRALLQLADEYDRRETLGKAARAYIAKSCTPDAVAARYLDILAKGGEPEDRQNPPDRIAGATRRAGYVAKPRRTSGW